MNQNDETKNETGKPKNATAKIVLISLLVMVLWGSLFPFVQWGFQEFALAKDANGVYSVYDLLLFAGVRFLVSGAILSAFCVARKKTFLRKQPKKTLAVVLVALFAVVLHYACTYVSLSLIDSSKTALLKQSGVLVFLCFSFLFFKEDKFSLMNLAGAVLGVASIFVCNSESLRFSFSAGTIVVIGASLCTVISNVVFKKSLGDAPAITVTGYSQLIGGAVLTAFALVMGGRLRAFSWTAVLIFVYIVAATVVSYSLWYSVVQKYELSKLFIIKMAEPLFAAGVSAILPLNAKFGWQHLAAFVLVFAAVTVSNIRLPKKEKKKRTEKKPCEKEPVTGKVEESE